MKIRLRLPAIPSISAFNAFLAAYSCCFYLINFLAEFVRFSYKKMPLAGSIFSYRPELQYTSKTFAGAALSIDNVFTLKV